MALIENAYRTRGQVGPRHRRAPVDLDTRSRVVTTWRWACLHCLRSDGRRVTWPHDFTVVDLATGDTWVETVDEPVSYTDAADPTLEWTAVSRYMLVGVLATLVSERSGHGWVLGVCERCSLDGLGPRNAAEQVALRRDEGCWQAYQQQLSAALLALRNVDEPELLPIEGPFEPAVQWLDQPELVAWQDLKSGDAIEWDGRRYRCGSKTYSDGTVEVSLVDEVSRQPSTTPPMQPTGTVRRLGRRPPRPRRSTPED